MAIAATSSKFPKFFKASLCLIATSHALRCDAKNADSELLALEAHIKKGEYFELGDFLPTTFVKGMQPEALDAPTDDSVPVINTLSIQKLAINAADCRHISRDDFEALNAERRVSKGDVLLTMDGGVSIGKPALFELDGDFTIDSHVCILRPKGLSSLGLVYLLASSVGQAQFHRAESGASGQTSVTEEDVRRFVFPAGLLKNLNFEVKNLEKERKAIALARSSLDQREMAIWAKVVGLIG